MSESHKINWQITHSSVVFISPTGVNMGVMSKDKAIAEAKKFGLDLVQVSGDESKFPICKAADYGKIRYNESKKKKHTHTDITKEINFGYNISQHDLDVKNKKVLEFLDKNYKVRYVLSLKGSRTNKVTDHFDRFQTCVGFFKDVASWADPKIGEKDRYKIIGTTLVPKASNKQAAQPKNEQISNGEING